MATIAHQGADSVLPDELHFLVTPAFQTSENIVVAIVVMFGKATGTTELDGDVFDTSHRSPRLHVIRAVSRQEWADFKDTTLQVLINQVLDELGDVDALVVSGYWNG